MSLKHIDLLICCGSGCISAGAIKIKERFHEVLAELNLTNEVNIIETGCMGPCDAASWANPMLQYCCVPNNAPIEMTLKL